MNYLGCIDECNKNKEACTKDSCRHWINYKDDLNCSIISADKNGPMTLEEIAKRMNITLVRIKQIQDDALKKMKKRILPIFHE